jgi:phytoene desaturase
VVFLVGLRRKLGALHHHNVYFSADYDKEFHQLFRDQKFPDDPTVYVNIPSRTDRNVAAEGGESLFIMANAPSGGRIAWNAQETDEAWAQVYNRLRLNGFPDIAGDIAFREAWTPMRFAQQYGMPGGAIYGLASHGWKTAFLRPSNKDRAVKGLYRVGGSSHPGGGTPMVLMSAKITSRLIAHDNYA